MSFTAALLARGTPVEGCRPWPRAVVDADAWREAAGHLQRGALTLMGLWGEPGWAHMALIDQDGHRPAILSLACPEGRFPSVGWRHAPAIRLERTITDLVGLTADDAPDARPWLDHGRWAVTRRHDPATPYRFLAAQGESLHQIAVGPVHAGVIEPGHFRFTAHGETIVRLEERLGYLHRGLESLMAGAPLDRAARLAGRASGDSTVAYGLAFSRAVEAALGLEPPPRAHWLRALMAECERLANHLGDIGAVCNDAAFALMLAHTGVLRERVLRACGLAFGHRLMMDRVVPGGVAVDLDAAGRDALCAIVAELRRRFPGLVALYDETTSIQDRTVGTGRVTPALAQTFGAGGFVGRASGRAFDARRAAPYAPYPELRFETPVRDQGDVDARLWIRIEEVRQSLDLIDQILARLPAGPHRVEARPGVGEGREGLGLVEGFRGDVLVWLRLTPGGDVERCHLRDPSWFQWPLLEVCVEGNIVADFPLCNKSFNCSYAGHDL